MVQNKMEEVAKLLGVELGEEFKIKGHYYKYKLSKEGLSFWVANSQEWVYSSIIGELLTGEFQIIKLPKPILDDVEKEYLGNIIKPFRKYTITIRKVDYYEHEYIEIFIYRPGEIVSCEAISFPYFDKGKMYKGMELDKEYTLEELEL